MPGPRCQSGESVHPRACGEHRSASASVVYCCGSSPRLRGTHKLNLHLLLVGRFIPAPAGNTSGATNWRPTSSVHPRACGEHPGLTFLGGDLGGSSPRLRGTRLVAEDLPPLQRFIPAPAGNTLSGSSSRTMTTVHPRACGEHLTHRLQHVLGCGSSPRLRGTHPTLPPSSPHRRFIPAPAGNTLRRRIIPNHHAVHPRACGEHLARGERVPISAGSSPRLRGTRLLCACVGNEGRFIPAPAGNTCPLFVLR